MNLDLNRQSWTPEELDLLTLIEPLACVQHAYRRLPETLLVNSACVFGGGPIGSLHLIELGRRFPKANLTIIDPSEARRTLAQSLFPTVRVLDSSNGKFDLTIVATSDPAANISAIQITKPMGTVIHFSGLNHKTTNDLAEVEGINIEKIHRNEEVRVLSTGVRLIGSSGYSRADILRSIQSLQEFPETYGLVQTSIVEGIDSKTLVQKCGQVRQYHQPVVEVLLRSDNEYLEDLKVIFRVQEQDTLKQVSPKKESGRYSAVVIEQELKQDIPKGYVRLQVLRFSICNTDRRVLDGTKSAKLTDSFILGHEGIGVIVGVGDGVDEKSLGQGISLILPHYYEENDPLLKNGVPYLSLQLKHLGIHINGCFASYVDVPEQCVFSVEPILNGQVDVLEAVQVA
ncbi:MAG: hypothetical protein B7Y39_19085 [Bdellovibrio sp. 28-41-41]|nr:MAG: hypothetical protein B7Y39_19085 [Bdellovibrio sp. 28-41-41]